MNCGTKQCVRCRQPRAVAEFGCCANACDGLQSWCRDCLLAQGWEPPRRALAPAILAPGGTWHRPLTTLELAVLQSLAPTLHGEPLVLAGKSDRRWREHIGNGIPRDAAEAWGRQLLECLLRSALGEGWRLCGGGQWVAPDLAGYAA